MAKEKDIAGLHPRMPFCEAASAIILAKMDSMFKHEAGTRKGEDIEALHDMRVASRRLRAAMDVFTICFPKRAYKPLHKTASLLTDALGEVRDRDVMLERLQQYQQEVPADERPGIASLMEMLREERAAHRITMQATLDDLDAKGFRSRMRALLKEEQ